MRTKLGWGLAILAVAFLIAPANAMNLNLAMPWSDGCSPPETPYLAFYSKQSDDMMFTTTSLPGKHAPIEIMCQAGLRSVSMTWTLHRNMIRKPFRSGSAESLVANKFRFTVPTEGLQPGFYDLRVILNTGMPQTDPKDRRPVTGVCTFGWNINDFQVRETRPKDFVAFWAKAKASVSAIPLDVKQETPMQTFTNDEINDYNVKSACLPPDYDPDGHKVAVVESCKISFAGPDGGRIYAWLAKPIGPGPFPGMLVLPGAGFAARPRPLEHARHGYLAIDVQIHGQDVDLPRYPGLPGYNSGHVYEPIDAFYFYKVHQRVQQAVNFLFSRPDVDKTRIAAAGASQGGRLGIVIAGLDPRIKALVAGLANSPNYPQLHWVETCNAVDPLTGKPLYEHDEQAAHLRDGTGLTGAPPVVPTPDGVCMAYYDPMNFAPDIHCPILMEAGVADPVSPPTSTWPCYLRAGTKNKTMIWYPGLGHDWSAEFDRRAWRWLDQVWSNQMKK